MCFQGKGRDQKLSKRAFPGGPVVKNLPCRPSSVVQWLRLHAPNAEGLGLIPDQGTRSHMPQPRVLMSQLKILYVAMKIKDPACHN